MSLVVNNGVNYLKYYSNQHQDAEVDSGSFNDGLLQIE
jgi:hypothetical protein